MKDRYFKFLAATLVIGVLLALVNPTQAGPKESADPVATRR